MSSRLSTAVSTAEARLRKAPVFRFKKCPNNSINCLWHEDMKRKTLVVEAGCDTWLSTRNKTSVSYQFASHIDRCRISFVWHLPFKTKAFGPKFGISHGHGHFTHLLSRSRHLVVCKLPLDQSIGRCENWKGRWQNNFLELSFFKCSLMTVMLFSSHYKKFNCNCFMYLRHWVKY